MAAATAAASSSSAKAGAADSYIGSLISLTSKSEIRYEGVLYSINTEESSIGLRNVRSFGTEGRKKDGPQLPPSDKIYDYVLFRGNDIKDLQVKSSPPVQTAPPMPSDPAIIQTHYGHPASPTPMPASLPSVGSGTVADLSSHTTQMVASRPTFQSGLPLYQPGGSLGSWGPTPPPTANGSGLAMPVYWQGFYAPSGGMPHLQPPPLLRPPGPPPGLRNPPSLQQPLQYPGMNPSSQSGSQNLPGANALIQSGLPNFPGSSVSSHSLSTSLPGISASSGFSNLSGISASFHSVPSNLPGISSSVSSGFTTVPGSSVLSPSDSVNLPEFSPLLPPSTGSLTSVMLSSSTQSTSLALDVPLSTLPSKPPVTSLPSTTFSDNLPFVSSLSSSLEAIISASKPRSTSGTDAVYQFTSPSIPSVAGSSSSGIAEVSMPSLAANSLLLQSGSFTSSSTQPLQKSYQATEVEPAASEHQKRSPVETKDAILPLPGLSDQKHGASLHTHHSGRGRGRGRGNAFSESVTKFTEDFDFTAMNEKFKKDEVWGHLGKSRGHSRDKEGNADESNDDDGIPADDDDHYSKFEVKPVYVKDDFFDSLSCNASTGARNGRNRFPTQRRVNTETFGDFSRHRPGHGGGRGFRGVGRRGSFYGRGYGNTGRGPELSSKPPAN